MDVRSDLSIKRVELEHIKPVKDKEHGSTQNNFGDHGSVSSVGDHNNGKHHHGSQGQGGGHGSDSEFEWLDSTTEGAHDVPHSSDGEQHIIDVKV